MNESPPFPTLGPFRRLLAAHCSLCPRAPARAAHQKKDWRRDNLPAAGRNHPDGLPSPPTRNQRACAKDVIARVEDAMTLTDFEKATFPNNLDVVRFPKILWFSTINSVKAGWLRKKKGVRSLTVDRLHPDARRPWVLASVGSVGDAYDNALAESFVDSFKTELVSDRVWRSRSQLELAVVEYIGWFNRDRLHESLGDLPPAEFAQLHAASKAREGPFAVDGSVARHSPRAAERLAAPPISATRPLTAPNGADPAEPAAAGVSLRSPSGLAALVAGTDPSTLMSTTEPT